MRNKDPYHISGKLHVTGQAKFIGDEIKPTNMLCVKILASPYAHAKILQINTKKATQLPGVATILTCKDIPGQNQIGHPLPDQPLLATTKVMHIGQPIAIVVANNDQIATHALTLIKVKYQKLPAILSIADAIKHKSYFTPQFKREISSGNLNKGFATSDFIIEDQTTTSSQEHVYLETLRCWAIPGDDNDLTLYAATQSISAVQEIAANVLNLTNKDITVDVKRLGGAFGGKEATPANMVAALAALAAYKTKKPVELKLSQQEDMAWTGKRHPFLGKYKIGFNKNGKINAYEIELYANGGAYADLTLAVLERAMLHADNAYYIPNVKITGYPCKTNLPPNTAFRGFGAPQGIFIIESAIEKIAHKLQTDVIHIREINLYKNGQTTPYGQQVHEAYNQKLLQKLKHNCQYEKLVTATENFNRKHIYKKRGLGVTPVKFGISFTQTLLNQGSSLIWIYADGSLSLSHGGIEMGQEVNTKVAQVVAQELGISLTKIRVESANTKRIGNASPTAASTGSDINGNAALIAAKELKQRLITAATKLLAEKFGFTAKKSEIVFANDKVFAQSKQNKKLAFSELAHFAYLNQVGLGAHGFYKTPGLYFNRKTGKGTPFYYYVFGVCLVQTEIDLLTGANKLLKVYIVHEAAKSLNQAIDLGQISGAFYQGYGWCTMEEDEYDAHGQYLATSLSTYKIPSIRELPETFDAELVELTRKHASILGSKAIGEPPFIYGEAAYFAIKHAIESAKNHQVPANLNMPATPEAILQAIENLES